MYSVGTRELKQHTGEIVERVRNGERVILTLRGEPVAVISPLDRSAIEEMCRVASGARIFPLLKGYGGPSPYLEPVMDGEISVTQRLSEKSLTSSSAEETRCSP